MPAKIKCLLVDDEPLANQLMKSHIEQLELFEVVGTCSSAIKALEFLRSTTVDLMFLDIKMPGLTGIEFMKTLRNPPAVIITTAYREYAIEAYELEIIDYLLKPITFDRFFKAADRYLRLKVQPQNIQLLPAQTIDFIYIKTGNKFHKLNTDEILYIESFKDYVIVHCNEQKINAKYKISGIEMELQGKNFLRIHRSFIVNLDKVTAFTAHDIEIGNREIPIGTNYKEYVFKILKKPQN